MATIDVTNTLDDGSAGSLNGAIASAASGDIIIVDPSLAGDTIDLTNSLDVTKGITIEGNGIALDGGFHPGSSEPTPAVTDLIVNTTGSVLIQGLIIGHGQGSGATATSPGASGGNAAGGLFIGAGSVTLTSVTFVDNAGYGGTGGAGSSGTSAAPNGGGGGMGGVGVGAIFNAGALTIDSTDTFSVNTGEGGLGGNGGNGYTKVNTGSTKAGYGGGGGAGGAGVGAIFNIGQLTNGGANIGVSNQGQGGAGGNGGDGGAVDINQGTTFANGGIYGSGGVVSVKDGAGYAGSAGYSTSGMQTGGAGGAGGGVGMQGSPGKQGPTSLFAAGGGGGGGAGLGYNGISCFCPGTMIATPDGESPVEDLRIGDLVLTASGAALPVKWIGRRAYAAPMVAANAQLRPVRIRAGALADGIPRHDLLVSPQHAMLVDGALVPAAALVNASSILREPATGPLAYLHVELAGGELLLAEGAATESFLDHDGRGMFQNAAQYAVLYPNENTAPLPSPAPRLTEGFRVATIRRRLARRAGAAAAPQLGRLRGHIERIEGPTIEGWVIEGWAQDETHPDQPVAFDIVVDGAPVGRLVANRYRADLDRAGLGSGIGGFRHVLATPGRHVALHRVDDGAALPAIEAARRDAA